MGFKTSVIIGDTHLPWWHEPSMSLVYALIDYIRPFYVVQIGDLYDKFSAASFAKSMNIMTPKEEIERSKLMATEMWATIRKLSPDSQCYQIKGNHDIRPYKRLMEKAPELEHFFNVDYLFNFDGVHTIKDPRTPLILDDILYTHGSFSNSFAHVRSYGRSVIHGHLHRGGLTIARIYNHAEWAFSLDCGYLGDPSAPCFDYTISKATNWQHGVGIITEFGPAFIPFLREEPFKK
jgi:hypothetical protein